MIDGKRGPHSVEDAEQVDVQHPLDRVRVDVQHRAVAGDTGIGDDGVDAAELLDGLCGRGLHGGEIADVGNHGQDVFVAAQFGGPFGQRRLVQVGQHQLGALGVQPAGHLGTDSLAATGDEYDLRIN